VTTCSAAEDPLWEVNIASSDTATHLRGFACFCDEDTRSDGDDYAQDRGGSPDVSTKGSALDLGKKRSDENYAYAEIGRSPRILRHGAILAFLERKSTCQFRVPSAGQSMSLTVSGQCRFSLSQRSRQSTRNGGANIAEATFGVMSSNPISPDASDPSDQSPAASTDLEIVESVEPVVKRAAKAMGTTLLLGLIFGPDIPSADSLTPRTTITVVDRQSGQAITSVRGITYEAELEAARSRFADELATMTTAEFVSRYSSQRSAAGEHWYRVHRCMDCARDFAGTELRAGVGERCPACAYDHGHRSLVARLRPSWVVIVPDDYFRVRCAQSFADRGWAIERGEEGALLVHRKLRERATIVAQPGVWVQRS
jgi:DNA-directed RNA polymerase subunit RPC12/RpoP